MKFNIDQIKKIVVIHSAFLGDVALSVYFCDKVKEIYPLAEITFITTPAASKIVSTFHSVDKVIQFDKRNKDKGLNGIRRFANQFDDIDLLFSLHKSFRSTLLSKLIDSAYSISYQNSALSFLYSKKVKCQKHLHEIDRDLLLLDPIYDFNVKYEGQKAKLVFKESDKNIVHNLINKYKPGEFYCIAPASVWNTKRWTEKGFSKLIELIYKTGKKVIIIGSKNDKDLCKRININNKAIDLSGETDLAQTMLLMSYSRAVVSNDSAPAHLAGLMKIPVVMIFGPTIKEFGFGPHGENDIIIENKYLKCRPCSIHGTNSCPIGTHECMKSIKAETILEAIEQIEEKSRQKTNGL